MSAAVDLQPWLAKSPFVAFLGLEIVAADPDAGELVMQMRFRPEFGRSSGGGERWHGGVISALADTAGDFALIMLHGAAPPTVNLRIDYLRPIVGVAVTARVKVRKTGRSIAFVDIDIHGEDGTLVAIARGNYATVGLPAAGPQEVKA
ncbi:PaaI family thioesterase [Rhizobium puerariae]|uniref:PaaI family thioesterase n=1 Tax=Rhizobium puerariae TaxID=1585791 RepID=A0ABV6AG68_9HYPH